MQDLLRNTWQVICHTLLIYLITPTSVAESSTIEALLAPLQKSATVAIMVSDLKSGQTLIAKNETIYLQPASTMKILTSIIATESLHHQRPFTTELRAYGHQNNQIFHGDIHLELGANPSFTDLDLSKLVTEIKKRNISQVDGNLLILKNHFDEIERIPGTVWDELNDCYAAPVSDISINQNCFYLTLLNLDNQISHYATESYQPTQLSIHIKDSCQDQKHPHSHYPAYGYGVFLKQYPFEQPDTLRGCWSKEIAYWVLKRSINHPDQLLKSRLQNALNQNNIQILGDTTIITRKPVTQQKPKWRTTIPSAPLSNLLRDMLEKSNNHIANQIFKESAYQRQQSTATWEDAQAHAQTVLEKYQLYDENSTITDGAGLSRNNRITAQQLQNSLIAIYRSPKLKPLVQLFANQDSEQSTLSKRLENVNLPIFAKTGSLSSVTAIAGYMDPYGPKPKAFTLIINGNHATQKNYLEIEPSLLQQIHEINKLNS